MQEDAEPILCELKRARAATLLADARRMQAAGQIEQAQSVVREVLELDPANRKARQMHAGLRAEQQRRMLQERLRALFQEADEEAAARRFARAVEILHSAAQLDGSGPEAEQRLEQMCARLERSQNAAQLLADAGQLLVEENLTEAHAKAAEAQRPRSRSAGSGRTVGRDRRGHPASRERSQNRTGTGEGKRVARARRPMAARFRFCSDCAPNFPDSPAVENWLARVEAQQVEHERQIRLQRELGEIRSLMAEERFPEAVARLTALVEEFPANRALPDLLAQARGGHEAGGGDRGRQSQLRCASSAGANSRRRSGFWMPLWRFMPPIRRSSPCGTKWNRSGKPSGLPRRPAQALDEAQWLLDQDRPHLAVRFLREKSAALPGQPELLARLDEIERMIPEWENRRFVQDCLSRAAALEQNEQWACGVDLDRAGARNLS